MSGTLKGRVVAIVGASSGIGRSTALAAHQAGAAVALAARDAGQLHTLAEELVTERNGDDVLTYPMDARRRSEVAQFTHTVLERFGSIDAVVFAAGWNVPRRALAELADEDYDTILDTNLRGAFLVTQSVLPAMRRQGEGLLVYISSSGAKQPDQSGAAYQASKAGVAALAHATMIENRGNGIRTTVLYPGLTATPFVRHRPTPPDPATLQIALQPEDVAAACLFVLNLPPRAHVPELLLYPTNL